MDKELLLATEKAIILDAITRGEPLQTDATRFTPTRLITNPISEHRIGRYRPFEKRICATAELDVIKQYLSLRLQGRFQGDNRKAIHATRFTDHK